MKEKKHKHLEDLFDEYIQLTDEQTELPSFLEKTRKKFEQHLSEDKSITYKSDDAANLFKYHSQIRKMEERKKEITEELSELESLLKEFLMSLQGGKISYNTRDDIDKSKNTYLFYLEGDTVKYNK